MLAGVLAIIATVGYLVWSEEQQRTKAQTVESAQTQIAERLADQLVSNKEINRRGGAPPRASRTSELPAVAGLSAAAIQKITDKKIAPLGLFVLASTFASAAVPSFPGAQGGGAASVGGRNGAVIEVTNLRLIPPDTSQVATVRKIV